MGTEFLFVLPEDQKPAFRRMVSEYWGAIIQETWDELKRTTAPNAKGELPPRGAAMTQEGLKHFAEEIQRACDRRVGAFGIGPDQFLATLGLSPEQEAEVRRVAEAHVLVPEGERSVGELRRRGEAILKPLSAAQRVKITLAAFADKGAAPVRAVPPALSTTEEKAKPE